MIGYHVVKALLAKGREVCCLVRPTSNTQKLDALGVAKVEGDLTNKDSLLRAMQGCDAVINVAGQYSFWEKDPSVFFNTNVEGTKNILEAALESGVKKAVHISAVGVWGKVHTSPFNEDTPEGDERFGIYFDTKYAGDLEAWKLAEKGLPLVVVYPCSVVGPDDQSPGGDYIRNLMNESLPAVVFPEAVLPYVDVDDVAESIVLALDKEDNIGEKYIVGKHHLDFRTYTDLVCKLAGTASPQKDMKDGMAIFLARVLTFIANVIKRPPLWGMTLDQMLFLRELTKGLRVDATKVERELGLEYTPIEETLTKAINSYK